MKKYVIIVAGGSGKRMGTDVPKQFLVLAGKPVLMHTIDAFYKYDEQIQVLLVLPDAHRTYWQELCAQYAFNKPVTLVSGGKERFFSVKNAMQLVPNNTLVAVHDGVRPLVDAETIQKAFESAQAHGSGVPVVPETDSLRMVTQSINKSVDRSQYYRVQTPQVFQSSLIKEAYNQEYKTTFTDDASVYESLGYGITLTPGSSSNLKITTPVDLKWAAILLHESV
jgi:2-C-methyl-D-erythritol 4-phosphate cytidylyltransferase